MVTPTYRNPLEPNDYVIYEEKGFEWKYTGIFKSLEPVRKAVRFLTEEFIEDNAKMGIEIKWGLRLVGMVNNFLE